MRKPLLITHYYFIFQGSVYRKVNAVEEIQQTKKDDFWLQTQVLPSIDLNGNPILSM